MSHLAVWSGIAAVVLSSTIGDVLQSRAMKEIGDLGLVRQSDGTFGVIRKVITNARFMIGLAFMAVGFFSLLITLSWGDVSIVGPASASLTFLANALVAHIYLKENVDRRRWMAALCVAGGVALLTR
jgi:drug/metabolite transporter (DMT)-like permease